MLRQVCGDVLRLPDHALHKICRFYGTQAATRSANAIDADQVTRTDPEWANAKPFSEVPRPSTFSFIRNSLPGGKYFKLSIIGLQRKLRDEFGPIVYLEGFFRRRPSVFVFDPEIHEKVFRNEGQWPSRHVLETFAHFRGQVRPDIFKDGGGLLTENGQKWADFRTLINPLLLKPKNVRYYLPLIDGIATEFVKRMKDIRDPKTLELSRNFENEANRWSLESISSVALNTRLGLLDHSKPNPRGEKLLECVKDFFQLTYELDFLPSLWKYFETPKLKQLMRAFDNMTEICLECINEARAKLDANPDVEDLSILAQLLKQDEHAAVILAMDLMIAGIDTTSSAFISVMYSLAKHPDKQEVLRKEILEVLPNKTDPVTTETLRNLPFLRACIKEALRIASIASGTTRDTPTDMVLAGYQVPKGTNIVLASMVLANDSQFFPEAAKFVPERWLRGDVHEAKACPMAKSKNPYSYLPFGFGPRMCIGKRLAEMEVETLLLKVFRNFKVEWHHGEMQYRDNIIRAPTGELKFKLIEIN